MSSIQALDVKKLRQKTGAGIMDCKQALKASGNNFDKAIDWLKKKGVSIASKKSGREAAEGMIASYIHGHGRIGVLLEVNSETDFVAKNEDFKSFVKELSLHIAAMQPLYVKEEDIPEKQKDKERKVFEAQALSKSKNKEVADRIAEGLYKKWLMEVCLLKQEFIREKSEGKQTVEQALNDLIAKVGENILIRRFVCFVLGETVQKHNLVFLKKWKKQKKGKPLSNKPKYKRILIKISGEMLAGKQGFGIQPLTLKQVADDLKELVELGVQVALVIGGGNIFRGVTASEKGMDRVNSDHMGMLATCINALALQNILEQNKVITRVLSAIEISDMAEPYIYRRALRHLEKNRLLIFAGGTGNPYFSTDTAAALRAMEIKADVLLKATKVDGVFDKDPIKNKNSKKFEEISYIDILKKNLKIMDGTAISLCRDNNMPLIAFNLKKKGNLSRVVCGEKIGTLIQGG